MNARAVLFMPQDTLVQRQTKAAELAAEIARELARIAKPLAAVLLGGRIVKCAAPDSPRYAELVGMRSAMLIGTYMPTHPHDRIARDVYETIAEHDDGCVIPQIIRRG